MDLTLRLILFTGGMLFFTMVLKMIRRHSLHPTYSLLWIFIGLFLVSISLFPSLFQWATSVIQMAQDSRHVVYIFLIAFLLSYVFYLTIVLSKLSERVHILICSHAVLEQKVKELK